MVRSELIARLSSENPHLSRKQVERAIEAIFNRMAEALENGGRVELRGFGTFSTRSRQARLGRNPRSGAAVAVKAKRVPFFKSSGQLRERVSAGVVGPTG